MAYGESHFEQKDISGSTVIYSGSANGGVALPSSAVNYMSEFLIENTGNNSLSLNFGATDFVIPKGGHLAWTPKKTKQFTISGSTTYQAIINFEDFGQ